VDKVYMYVVDRDFGFAPNPFHGVCTLATCKPPIRKGAQIGDWVIGMGGRRLKARGRCVYAMRVTETLTFNEYWASPTFFDKRPVRNGSSVMMVGDNIYHRDNHHSPWTQSDSHHSLPNGMPNLLNINKDTSTDRVLASREFFYFGKAAPTAPSGLLEALGFQNRIGHRVFDATRCVELLAWIMSHKEAKNMITADPFDFDASEKRYSGRGSALS
jgi:Nucleotide modification associated domain 2